MKALIIIQIFTFLTLNCFGQDLLKTATEKYNSTTSYRVDMSISISNQPSQAKQWQKADLIVHGDKYILALGNQLITSDATDLYTYSPMLKELVIEPIDTSSPLQSPRELFSISQDNYELTNTTKTAGVTSFTLKSKSAIANIKNIIIKVHSGALSEITITDNGDNEIAIKIHSTDFTEEIDASIFIFDKKRYKGVEIIDFR